MYISKTGEKINKSGKGPINHLLLPIYSYNNKMKWERIITRKFKKTSKNPKI